MKSRPRNRSIQISSKPKGVVKKRTKRPTHPSQRPKNRSNFKKASQKRTQKAQRTAKRIKRKQNNKQAEPAKEAETTPQPLTSESDEELLPSSATSLPSSKLMSRFESRLKGGHFRYLNQGLYLSTGKDSFTKFQTNQELFQQYHQGYLQSMQNWTVQPVDVAIRWLRKQPPNQRIIDYGCGEAKIMQANLSHGVTSLDLVALHPGVIAGDMAHSPVDSASQDIAIFSLSLMGTDYHACLLDAARVLKANGLLWIAEVCSRFVNSSGKEDYHAFFAALGKLGFERVLAKKPSSLFVVLIFKKVKSVSRSRRIDWPFLKPCLYKKR